MVARLAAISFCTGTALLALNAVAGPLHDALRAGDLSETQRLIASGADLVEPDDAGLMPLVVAALGGNRAGLVLLLENGADPQVRDAKGFTALHAAAHAGHPEIVRLLLVRRLDANDQENFARVSPLHLAAERGFTEIVEILLVEGADLKARSGVGHTPLSMAVLNSHATTTALLRDRGADCKALKMDRYREYCRNARP